MEGYSAMSYGKYLLVFSALLAGCGDSGGDSAKSSSDDETQVQTQSVDAPTCTDTNQTLPQCWASSCEPLESTDPKDVFYGRSVISFASSGELRHYLQSFDNANCIAPAVSTTEIRSELTYRLLPRDENRDQSTTEGRIEFKMSEASRERASESLNQEIDGTVPTPYDITDQGLLCFDTDMISFSASGWKMKFIGLPGIWIDYENCLSPVSV